MIIYSHLKTDVINKFLHFTFSHLADTFIQSNLQMRKTEAIKPTKEYKNI